MGRIERVPGKPLGANWLWCALCAVQVRRSEQQAHEMEKRHGELYGQFSRQMALDRVIPVLYDDKHYGLFEGDASHIDAILFKK